MDVTNKLAPVLGFFNTAWVTVNPEQMFSYFSPDIELSFKDTHGKIMADEKGNNAVCEWYMKRYFDRIDVKLMTVEGFNITPGLNGQVNASYTVRQGFVADGKSQTVRAVLFDIYTVNEEGKITRMDRTRLDYRILDE